MKLKRLTKFSKMVEHEEDEEFGFIDFQKVDVEKRPCRIVAVMKIPGLYQIIFSNQGSWFRAKELAYRINVLDAVSLPEELVKLSAPKMAPEMLLLEDSAEKDLETEVNVEREEREESKVKEVAE